MATQHSPSVIVYFWSSPTRIKLFTFSCSPLEHFIKIWCHRKFLVKYFSCENITELERRKQRVEYLSFYAFIGINSTTRWSCEQITKYFTTDQQQGSYIIYENFTACWCARPCKCQETKTIGDGRWDNARLNKWIWFIVPCLNQTIYFFKFWSKFYP